MEQNNVFHRLTWLQRIGFGSGDLAQNLIYQTICMYLLIFYTKMTAWWKAADRSNGLSTVRKDERSDNYLTP